MRSGDGKWRSRMPLHVAIHERFEADERLAMIDVALHTHAGDPWKVERLTLARAAALEAVYRADRAVERAGGEAWMPRRRELGAVPKS